MNEILMKYTNGEKTLEETNAALKEAGANFYMDPEKHNLTPEEIMNGTAGLLFTALYIFLASKYIFKEYWFEKAMFSWGWFTGTMAMGMALLRIADPEGRSHCVDHYAIAYIFIAPVEIALITFAPVIFSSGYGLLFSGICAVVGLSLMTYMLYNKKVSKE